MGTFIDSTHETLVPFEVISSGCNALVTFIDSTHETLVPFEVISSGFNALVLPFQQLLEGPMDVLLCERVNDLVTASFISSILS